MLHEDRRVALVQPASEEASWWRNADTPALFFSLLAGPHGYLPGFSQESGLARAHG